MTKKDMDSEIQIAFDILCRDGTIVYPTDTVWGTGCAATSDCAVEKLYRLKQNGEERASLVLVSSINMIYEFVWKVPEEAISFIKLANKPLTVIFPRAYGLSKTIVGKDGSIGIRLVKHEFCKKLIKKLKVPLVSTSANVSGMPAPKCFDDISADILKNVDHVVDKQYAGKMTGTPSAIIKVGMSGEIEFIRK
ncbi:MAG: threonylcarbamoyl-AMP synthase [Prevotellaceae bacterium]|jgi:L-threonylcarbamoyladenylate synthase|nr:threonylcarbamoyl-AMP synthase [Prevotellaceae bacterium]